MRSILFCIFVLCIATFSHAAWATSCLSKSPEESIQDADIIFRGIALKTEMVLSKKNRYAPDSVTTFNVLDVYKGDIEANVDIHHDSSPITLAAVRFSKGQEFVVFSRKSQRLGEYVTGFCSRRFRAEDFAPNDPSRGVYEGSARLAAKLQMHKGKLDALDDLITKFPDNPWMYLQKGEVLEEFGDHQRAVPVYKSALEKARTSIPDRLTVVKSMAISKAALSYDRALHHSEGNEAASEAFTKSELCKYVKSGPPGITTTAPKPLIFANVKGVYLWVETEKKLSSNPLFGHDQLSRLAQCVVVGRLVEPEADRNEPSIPVEILRLDEQKGPWFYPDWPQARKPGNLLAFVSVEHVRDHEGLALLHARYFRSDTNHISNEKAQCARVFAVSNDGEETLKALTSAMHSCLRRSYHSRAVDTEPD